MAGDAALSAARWSARCRQELLESVLPFWLRHSLDREHGGYLNCLDRDGTPYDTKKHVWLQGRQVWLLARLCADLGPRAEWLEAAALGARFLRDRCRRPDRRVWFCVTRDGRPVQLQRKIYSECFYVMALAQYARAGGEEWAAAEARAVFGWVRAAADDPSLAGRPAESGAEPLRALAVPMILLNLVRELDGGYGGEHGGLAADCARRIREHARAGDGLALEHVRPDGSPSLDSPEGRLVNPGHAIEAGWFLLDWARAAGDEAAAREALEIVVRALDFGWDAEHGGLYSFLDVRGHSPVQLEWPMKLWWPHCEALVALAEAWRHTRDPRWMQRFEEVAEWTFARFPDAQHGEWYGYLDRAGGVTHRFKGGPYKGCFHVPRALHYAARALDGGRAQDGG
jgi:N-acylglucosamine 2-epimerase